MAFSQLDPNTALVLIDLQKGIAGRPAAHPSSEIVARAGQLAQAFRKKGSPVVLVNVAGRAPGRTDTSFPTAGLPPDWAELVPELDAQPSDIRVTKHAFGAFINTPLHEELKKLGVTQIVLGGISTSIGVESTARSAYDYGYNVAFVTDAMTDMSAENHSHSVGKVFPRLGESTTTETILKLLK